MKVAYLINCSLLLIPIFLWNIFLFDLLPVGYSGEVFDHDIPNIIRYGENGLRVIIFGLPLIMILSLRNRIEKNGLILYLFGILVYFASWLALIIYPESNWSHSFLGFMSPAFTPLLWLMGIGIIGNRSFIKIRQLSLIYILFAILFVCLHSAHAYIVFQRQ